MEEEDLPQAAVEVHHSLHQAEVHHSLHQAEVLHILHQAEVPLPLPLPLHRVVVHPLIQDR